MSLLLPLQHGEEHEAEDLDEEEIDERVRGGPPQVELADGDLRQGDAEEVRGLARSTARQYERLGVDEEAVDEPQQDRDRQHALQARELDVAEHRPASGAVDGGRPV